MLFFYIDKWVTNDYIHDSLYIDSFIYTSPIDFDFVFLRF